MKRLLRNPAIISLLLLAFAVTSLLAVDGVNRSPAPASREVGGADASVHSRALVLIVDGLRYETALNDTIMPALARLRETGASGKLETVFEGFSVPAIKAAFTGTAETQLVNVVRNFRYGLLPIESVFLDAERANKRVLIVGDEPFVQFGSRAERRVPPKGAGMYAEDRLRPGMALDAWRNELFDLVVCHYETTDWRAHEYGIHAPQYRAAFAAADSVIANFAATRQPGDYLLVFGDHGHNEAGEHKTGIYIPSFALMIGPDVRAGAGFPSLQIGNMRLLVSHALGIQLHTAPYQLAEIEKFVPVAQVGKSVVRVDHPGAQASHNPQDWLLFALFALSGIALGALVTRAIPADAPSRAAAATMSAPVAPVPFFGSPLTSYGGVFVPFADTPVAWSHAGVALMIALFVAELLAQQLWTPLYSLFPFLLLVVGLQQWRSDRWRSALLLAIGAFFVSRYTFATGSAVALRVPTSLPQLAPLYVAGTIARLFLLLSVAGKRQWPLAAALTALLTLIGVRVWDAPAISIGTIVVILSATLYARQRSDAGVYRALLVSLGYLLLYYMVRLPIYQLFWIDLFLLAVFVAHNDARSSWHNTLRVLVISGTFTLTSLWLSTGLEWGFLYGLVPAYTLERHVAWFLPLILFKIPLLLVLVIWILNVRPDRTFVLLVLAYAGIRFAAVWIARLEGASSAGTWPIAEQGVYLLPFVVVALFLSRRMRQVARIS